MLASQLFNKRCADIASKDGLRLKPALAYVSLIATLLFCGLNNSAGAQTQSSVPVSPDAPIATRLPLTHAAPEILVRSSSQNSINEESLNALIDERIALAIDRISTAQIHAPEAARLYLMVALALSDSYAIANGKEGMIAKDKAPHAPDSYELMEEVSRIVIGSTFDEPYPEATLLGHHIAEQILAHFRKPEAETLLLSGKWTPTGAPVLPHWAKAKPFFLSSAAQFRPSGPPVLGSSRYNSAFETVSLMGEDASSARALEQMETARFWMDKFGTATPPGRWNFIALEQMNAQNLPFKDRLSTLLSLNAALYDTGIAAWDAKYHFQFWRPDAAIADMRASDPAAQNWLPMMDNPDHPEYVSGHSAFSAAAAYILTQKLGASAFCTRAEDMWDQARCYDDFDTAAREAGQSRIYGGIHFDFSNEDGLKLGEDVARHVFDKLAN